MAECPDQRPQVRPKLPVIAVGQRGGDRLSQPDLAHNADDLRLEPQILDDDLGGTVPDGLRREGFWIYLTALLAGHGQGHVFLGLATRGRVRRSASEE